MSFDLKTAGGYGSGSLGDVTDPITDPDEEVINSYAVINSIDANTITISDVPTALGYGLYHDLTSPDIVGTEVLIHAFACTSGGRTTNPQLGSWRVAKIIQTSATETSEKFSMKSFTLTLSEDLSDLNTTAYYWQVITIPHFKSLTLTNSNITPGMPQADDHVRMAGGVLALKCSDTLTLNGGHIDLRDCGLNTSTTTTYRPNTPQEQNGVLDTALYSGCENSITKDHLYINCGDGACWIIAKNIVTKTTSRIGNPYSKGVQYCRGASDSKISHSGSNVGGSTIFIATSGWTGFTAANISKYRSGSGGRGLARAYIASRNLHAGMLPDEGLYALDTFSVKSRLMNDCKIKSFGDGSDSGTLNFTATTPLSSYARVDSVSGKTFNITKAITGLVDFANSKLVMVHQLQKSSGKDVNSGRFYLARITSISGSTVTLDTASPFTIDVDNYYVQMLTVPQAINFNLSIDYKGTPGWYEGVGGIFALACSGTFNLTGKINLQGRGTLSNITNPLVGNHFMRSKLYIGQGHGTAFILANKITMGADARIGATYDGAAFGGKAVINESPVKYAASGYAGSDGICTYYGDLNLFATGGHGGAGGDNPNDGGGYADCSGGWFSNAEYAFRYSDFDGIGADDPRKIRVSKTATRGGLQGAHILIVADTINNFTLSAISTGGAHGGYLYDSYPAIPIRLNYLQSGGCGYGGAGLGMQGNGYWSDEESTSLINYAYAGSGGYRGGGASPKVVNKIGTTPFEEEMGEEGLNTFIGGGGAGACYIYCNNYTNQSTTGIITV